MVAGNPFELFHHPAGTYRQRQQALVLCKRLLQRISVVDDVVVLKTGRCDVPTISPAENFHRVTVPIHLNFGLMNESELFHVHILR